MRISDWSSDVCSSDLLVVCSFELEILAKIRGFRVPPVGALLGATDSRGSQQALVPHHTGWCSVAARSSRPCRVFARLARSEARRVGEECVSTCRSRWSPYH